MKFVFRRRTRSWIWASASSAQMIGCRELTAGSLAADA